MSENTSTVSTALMVANPPLAHLPVSSLNDWRDFFIAMSWAAPTFDEVYPATRTHDEIFEELLSRNGEPVATPVPADDDPRLFDHYQA